MYSHSAPVNISTLYGQLELHQKRNTYQGTSVCTSVYMYVCLYVWYMVPFKKADEAGD